MNRKLRIAVLAVVCTASTSVAHAEVSFHGYGQTVVGTTLSNNRQFPNGQQFGVPTYSADPNFQPESNFALQATAPVSDSINAVAQVLALGIDDFQPKFQWAYLKYQFNDAFALKAGRLQLPLYIYSDFLYVGEAYPWIVPPQSVYLAQVTNYDGFDLSAEQSIGDWYLYAQFYYGSVHRDFLGQPAPLTGVQDELHIDAKNNLGFTLDATYNDWLTLHGAFIADRITLCCESQIQSIVDALYQQNLNDGASGVDARNDVAMYWNAGIQINRARWVILSEYSGLGYRGDSALLPIRESAYISVGRRIGRLTPMVTYGHQNQWMSTKMTKSIPDTAIDPNTHVPFDTELLVISQSPNIRGKDSYYGVVLRYDLTNTVALKLDFTHYDSHYHTSDYPFAVFAGYTNPQDANRLSAAVTFTF